MTNTKTGNNMALQELIVNDKGIYEWVVTFQYRTPKSLTAEQYEAINRECFKAIEEIMKPKEELKDVKK